MTQRKRFVKIYIAGNVSHVYFGTQMNGTPTKPTLRRIEKSIASARSEFWTYRPEADVRRLVERAIRDLGHDKAFWMGESIRAALAHYASKKDVAPEILKPRD